MIDATILNLRCVKLFLAKQIYSLANEQKLKDIYRWTVNLDLHQIR